MVVISYRQASTPTMKAGLNKSITRFGITGQGFYMLCTTERVFIVWTGFVKNKVKSFQVARSKRFYRFYPVEKHRGISREILDVLILQ